MRLGLTAPLLRGALALAVSLTGSSVALAEDGEAAKKEAQSAEKSAPAKGMKKESANVDVSKKDMKAFVKVQEKIRKIRDNHRSNYQKARKAKDKKKAREIGQKMRQEMLSAVKETENIDPALYQKIAQAVQTNKEVRKLYKEVSNG